MLAFGFYSGKSSWDPLQRRPAETMAISTMGLILEYWLTLPSCSRLSLVVSALLISGWGETKVSPSCSVPKSFRILITHPTIPFLSWDSLTREFPLGTEQFQPGGWNNARKWSCSSSPFYMVILRDIFVFSLFVLLLLFPLLCCQSILSELLSPPEAVFVHG